MERWVDARRERRVAAAAAVLAPRLREIEAAEAAARARPEHAPRRRKPVDPVLAAQRQRAEARAARQAAAAVKRQQLAAEVDALYDQPLHAAA
jgi:hypothetical protein